MVSYVSEEDLKELEEALLNKENINTCQNIREKIYNWFFYFYNKIKNWS